jgi:hypothetical protein
MESAGLRGCASVVWLVTEILGARRRGLAGRSHRSAVARGSRRARLRPQARQSDRKSKSGMGSDSVGSKAGVWSRSRSGSAASAGSPRGGERAGVSGGAMAGSPRACPGLDPSGAVDADYGEGVGEEGEDPHLGTAVGAAKRPHLPAL